MATSHVTTVELVRLDEPLNATERGAIAGFLAGYTGNTLISYTTDLRLFIEWCITNDVRLLEVRRAHLEIFGRTMEADGRMRSTVARRLSTLGSFYRYCGLGWGNGPQTQEGRVPEQQTERMDRYAADRTVKRLAKRAGITKRISPHVTVQVGRGQGPVVWSCSRAV